MIENEKLRGLIAEVREHLVYAKELGVELLDVAVNEGRSVETRSVESGVEAIAAAKAVDVPRELPDVPVEVPVMAPKTTVRKPSKLSGLPSLSKRPTMTGNATSKANEIHDLNAASQTSEATREIKAPAKEPSSLDALISRVASLVWLAAFRS